MAEADPDKESNSEQDLNKHPFKALGLTHKVVRAVAKSGYENPTNIQSQAIPVVLKGRDVIGSSQTGTGKLPGNGAVTLLELLEDGFLLIGGNADATIFYADLEHIC